MNGILLENKQIIHKLHEAFHENIVVYTLSEIKEEK